MGYSRLEHVTEWLQWVREGYRVVTVIYRRLPSGYSGLQQITQWLQWFTAGYRVVTVG